MIGSTWVRLAAGVGAFLCLAAAATSQGATSPDGVLNVRFGGDRTQTRVVIELGRSAKGRLIDDGTGGKPVTLALPGVPVPSDRQGQGLGLVSGWSLDSAAGAARLRLQLAGPAQVRRRFLLPPSDGVSVYRYVIDLDTGAAAPPQPAAAPVVVASARPVRANLAAPLAVTPVVNAAPLRKRKVIVIDAGHGGHDPGALGADSREKDINLAAAKLLKAKLERTGRYRVVMTRDSDTFIPLETRVQIARRADADLFISLHSDSGPDPSMRGATVYTLSDKGSDRVARNVMSDNDWFINVNLPGRDRAVNQILLDLTQRATRNHSAAFAEGVLDHIADRAQAHRSHRDAGFVVLLAPDVPAVLLEMGYITNPEDERLLNDPGQRGRMMSEVADAIDDYFDQQTRLAAR
ncbi:MAG: N-acetylmuramoyl-L-alanine amidase [Caulobacteraceae bacterium]|nr:N-acetylmuramoyl-L-alanine amidase [Caulobacteraceae bacterium]